MIDFKSLQTQLERNVVDVRSSLGEAALNAAESGGNPEDMRAFADASQSMATATSVMNESLRAHHGMTKAVIDGIQ